MPDYPTTALVPDAVTEHYSLPLWGPDQPADMGRTSNATAAAADAAIFAGVADAHAAEARITAAARHTAFLLLGA